MADEPVSPDEDKPANGATPPPATPPAGASADGAKPAGKKPSDEALSDGTVPTVLETGHTPPPAVPLKTKAGLGSVYRRADITTTLITFGVGVAVAVLALLGYLIITKTHKATTPPKTSTLSAEDLKKLGAFFGGNSAGSTGEILTFTSPSLFKGRVGVNTDLAVSGNTTVSGGTNLGDLTVDKTSTLGVTNIRGQLSVAGPVTLQSPAILSGGASINGNQTTSGNGSFGGSLSAGILNATTLSVTGVLNLAGHLVVSGSSPGISSSGGVTGATVEGNDVTGVVSFNSSSPTGQFVTINYHNAYAKQPHVLITPASVCTGNLHFYVIPTGQFFQIGADGASGTTGCGSPANYVFDYWVVQ